MNNVNLKFVIGLFVIMILILGCSLFNNGNDKEDIPLVGPYQVDFDNYEYTLALICDTYESGEDLIFIMPTSSGPDSLSVDDVSLQINGNDVELAPFFYAFLAIYPCLEGEYYDFILTINGESSTATLQRPYSVNISFPDSLIIGEQYLIEWNISINNLNQGFITETEITNENYDELIYYELDPSIREFLYTNDWLDSLDIEEGYISLALSQWNCAQNNDVYFVSEYYLEENYFLSGMKSTHDPNITINKIIERITKRLK